MVTAAVILQAIHRQVREGLRLRTPRGVEFVVQSVEPSRLVFRVGEGSSVYLRLSCVSDVVDAFGRLPPDSWLRIGAIHGAAAPTSLDGILQRHSGGASAASYFAPILEYAQVAEINRQPPAKIRLKT
jgi:hypothetical protein